jgi:hypothetical protein
LAQQDVPPGTKKGGPFVQWWKGHPVMAFLSGSTEEKEALARELDRLQLEIWAKQTALGEALNRVHEDLWDLSIPDQVITEHQTISAGTPYQAINQLKLEAHLLVRRHIKADQIDLLREQYPQFFRASWFPKRHLAVFFQP